MGEVGHMKLKKSWLVLLIAAVFALSACSQKSGGSAKDSDTIKVGIVTSLSGPYAILGADAAEGIEYAAKEINANGGIAGKKIELIKEDDEGKPDIALRKAEKIITKDGAKFILGPISSAISLALAAKMPAWDAVYIASISKTPKLTTTDLNDHIFRVNDNDNMDMATISGWYERDLVGNSWYMIGSDYEWGHSSLGEFRKIAESHNDKIVGEAYVPMGTTDFSSQITNILKAKPDGIWVAVTGSDGINFMKQAKSFGLTDKVKIATFLTDAVVNGAGKDALGVLGNMNYHYSLDNPFNKKFVENFEKEYKKKPGNNHATAYMSLEILAKAIEKSGSADTKSVIKAMENITFDSPLGEVTMNPKDHQLPLPNYVSEVIEENGKATMKVIYSQEPK